MFRKKRYSALIGLLLLVSLGAGPVLAQESPSTEPARSTELSQEHSQELTSSESTQESISTTEWTSESQVSTEATTSSVDEESLQAYPEGIIDGDNQFLVRNPSLDPYRKIVRLESYFAARPLYGTGVLVGPDLVLTAAHNVYDTARGKWTQDVWATPAQNGDATPYGSYQASRVFILKKYQEEKTGNKDSYDMALIKLSKPVDVRVGYLPLTTVVPLGSKIQVAGYPFASDWKIGFLYSMWGQVSAQDGNLIQYQIDTESGQSGSPVLNEKNEIVAVHTLGFVDGNQNYTHNSARLVKQDSLDMLAFAKGDLKSNQEVLSQWLIEKSVYRLYHGGIQRHLYTQDQNEVSVLKTRGWNYEGVNFKSADHGTPVYRLYSAVTKEHLYTTSSTERDILVKRGWYDEEVAWYSQGETPVYRLYHTGLRVHLYTSDSYERTVLIKRGWLDESIAWYAQ